MKQAKADELLYEFAERPSYESNIKKQDQLKQQLYNDLSEMAEGMYRGELPEGHEDEYQQAVKLSDIAQYLGVEE